jgi:predicted dehydrogenase
MTFAEYDNGDATLTRLDGVVMRVAIVGLGWWGRTIARDLAASQLVEVVLGVDPQVETVSSALDGGLPFEVVSSFDDALARPDVEAVILCSPHRVHAEQIEAAARAGKHIFCEKPLATTLAEAERAARAVAKAGVHLGVGHERRFEAPVMRLHELLAAGSIGEALVFEANFSQDKFLALDPSNWRLSPEEAPAGPLSATGIHLVDLAVSVFGPGSRVWARLATHSDHFRNGDTLTVSLEFESGGLAMITAVLATPFIGRMTLLGSEGWVEIRDLAHPEDPRGWMMTENLRADPAIRSQAYEPHSAVRANIEAFVASAQGGPAYPIGVDDMLATCAAFEAIVQSAHTGQVVEVARPNIGIDVAH